MGSENKTNEETSFQPSEPKLCPMGCGFFGSPSTLSLCSKCYRNLQLTDEERASAKGVRNLEFNSKCVFPSTFSFLDTLPGPSAAPTHPFTFGTDGVGHDDKPKEKLPLRCKSCNKKVGLTGFKCRCGCTFCGVHRYPEQHECSFDFKASGRDAIEKANPVVKADKLERL